MPDVKPLAVDQCLRISFGPLPPTSVRQPYQQRVGFTLFGVEVFGFTIEGEGRLLVSDLRTKPYVVGEAEDVRRKEHHQSKTHDPAGGLRIQTDR